ncbi:unnamed protein product [Schistosoma curassoni]|uniref:Uncharacterized protein n=1 Tax=Schistosoma curassoni TaxID=6186 RepID=A0A183JYU8_9TREM|nr:unnamed protein product [Schistosoma curassoni]
MFKSWSEHQLWDIACTNPITIDGEDLEDVETFTYLGSIIDEQGGSDADVKAWIGKLRATTSTTEEHLELKTTVNQQQSQNSKYKCQDSSTVRGGNLENYESHHPEDTGAYQQLSTQNTSNPLTRHHQ